MTRTARTLAVTLLATLALCATATAGGPALSAGYGCAVACIERALVTPTASSASVEVKTSVPTSVTVAVARLDAKLGLAAGPAPRDIVVPSFQTLRTVLLPGLAPATTYRIVVSARDLQGHVQTRSGMFTTREVKVAVPVTRSFRCARGTHTATADYAQSIVEANEQNNVATHTASCLGLTS